jgi:predicted N-formylglutamate amidohydrolase
LFHSEDLFLSLPCIQNTDNKYIAKKHKTYRMKENLTIRAEKPYLTKDKKEDLRNRIHAIRPHIDREYLSRIVVAHPEYDTPVGRTRVRNVKNGVVYDERITQLLEADYKEMNRAILNLKKA